MANRARGCVLLALLVLLAAGCTPTGAPAPAKSVPPGTLATRTSAQTEPLLVLAASDLQYALPEIAAEYEAATGHKPTLSFGSTGNFSAQIENGAPADLFFAANESFIDGLIQKDLLLADTRQLYASGRIVVAPSKSASLQATTLKDLLRPELRIIAIANPEHAPYGLAAQQALQSAGLWAAVEPKVVLGENISQTFQHVQTGNADAGIVALSVVLGIPGTPYTLVDESLHAPLAQAAAVLKSSKQPDTARAFLAFVNGERGRPIMKKFGFVLPGES